MHVWIALVAVVCLCTGCPRGVGSQTDVVLQRTVRVGNAAAGETGMLYWGSRIRVSDDSRKRLIFDLDAKTLTFLDKAARTYMVRTLDEIARKYRDRVSPDGATAVLAATGKTEPIAGYDAREYTFASDRVRGAVWISDELRPPPAWKEWERIIAFLEGVPAGGTGVTAAVEGLGGYPLRTVLTFGAGAKEGTITTQISAVSPGPPAEDLTAIPENFRRATDIQLPG